MNGDIRVYDFTDPKDVKKLATFSKRRAKKSTHSMQYQGFMSYCQDMYKLGFTSVEITQDSRGDLINFLE